MANMFCIWRECDYLQKKHFTHLVHGVRGRDLRRRRGGLFGHRLTPTNAFAFCTRSVKQNIAQATGWPVAVAGCQVRHLVAVWDKLILWRLLSPWLMYLICNWCRHVDFCTSQMINYRHGLLLFCCCFWAACVAYVQCVKLIIRIVLRLSLSLCVYLSFCLLADIAIKIIY